MKWLGWTLTCLLLAACASVGGAERRAAEARLALWHEAHAAVAAGQFGRADTLYGTLIGQHGATEQGRESLFYLGALRLDPRNPNWSSALAETALEMYLGTDSTARTRRPEARTLYELARQLNLPSESRAPGLQAETRVVERPVRVVVPGREASSLQAEVNRLREQINTKDATIKRQEEELDRIRRTLAAPGR
jgi:hypothetical protein